MGMPIRCEFCGEMNVTTGRGRGEVCHSCGRGLTIPAGLTGMPTPQLAGDATVAIDADEEDSRAVHDVVGRAFPWLVSFSLHVALALILAMIVVFVVPELPDPTVPMMSMEDDWTPRSGNFVTPPLTPPTAKESATSRSKANLQRPARKLEMPKAPAVKVLAPGAVPLPGQGAKSARRPGGLFVNLYGPTGPGGNGMTVGPGLVEGEIGVPPKRVLFLIDRSGSMVDSLGRVKREILRAIGHMKPDQEFHVILFADGAPLENTPRRFVAANQQNKDQLVVFLKQVRARGKTDPVPAIARAAKVVAGARRVPARQDTTLVQLLTDGVFPDNPAVLTALQSFKRYRALQVNTYLFGQCPPVAQDVMQRIADEYRGVYRPVGQSD